MARVGIYFPDRAIPSRIAAANENPWRGTSGAFRLIFTRVSGDETDRNLCRKDQLLPGIIGMPDILFHAESVIAVREGLQAPACRVSICRLLSLNVPIATASRWFDRPDGDVCLLQLFVSSAASDAAFVAPTTTG
jgi:hypothetical protein